MWFKFWQNISNNGSHLTLRILRQKKHLFRIFFISFSPHHCQSHAIFSDAYFTVEIILGRMLLWEYVIMDHWLLYWIIVQRYTSPFTLLYIQTFHFKEKENFCTISRSRYSNQGNNDRMENFTQFSTVYNYNLKLSIKLFQTFLLQTKDKVASRVLVGPLTGTRIRKGYHQPQPSIIHNTRTRTTIYDKVHTIDLGIFWGEKIIADDNPFPK